MVHMLCAGQQLDTQDNPAAAQCGSESQDTVGGNRRQAHGTKADPEAARNEGQRIASEAAQGGAEASQAASRTQ